MYKLFISHNKIEFCIREKINNNWHTIYAKGNWIDIISDKKLHKFNYDMIIDDQDKIKQILIGLI
jgi:hypothetical protein